MGLNCVKTKLKDYVAPVFEEASKMVTLTTDSHGRPHCKPAGARIPSWCGHIASPPVQEYPLQANRHTRKSAPVWWMTYITE